MNTFEEKYRLALIIFGRKWLEVYNPKVVWHNNCVHITRKDVTNWTIHLRKSTNVNPYVAFKNMSLKKLSNLITKNDNELFTVLVPPNLKNMSVSKNFSDIISDFHDIFVEELPDSLLPSRDLDFEINLKSNEPRPVRPILRLSAEELKELKKQIKLLLQNGLIRPSSSPNDAPFFSVKKINRDLRFRLSR